MTDVKLTNYHKRVMLPTTIADDVGIETEISSIGSEANQISQSMKNIAGANIADDPHSERPDRRNEHDQSEAIEARYALALADQVEFKRVQANNIEQRLIQKAQRQSERLAHLRRKPPGILSMPSSKRKWDSEVLKESNRLGQTQGRLALVREIKDGMGVMIPRLQEVAAAKLRATQPELTRLRDEARRVKRAQVQENKLEGRGELGNRPSGPRSQGLSLTVKT